MHESVFIVWWKLKLSTYRGLNSKTKKIMLQASPFCWNFIAATQNGPQEFVWPPRACMHAWQRQDMLLMRRRMVSWGISSQIWTRASLSSWTVWGATWRHQMDRNIMSLRCSIGFRPGEKGDHSMVSIASSSRNCLHTLATWGRALPCTRRNPGPTAQV